MADDKIRLGLDLGDTPQQAAKMAASLVEVKTAAKGVGDAYDLVSDEVRESDVAFAAFRQEMGLDVAAVNKLVGTYGLLSQELADARRNAIALDGAIKSSSGTYDVVAGPAGGAVPAGARDAQAASDRSVAAAVRQTQAYAAMRNVLVDIPPAFQRTTGVIKGSADAMGAAAKQSSQFGQSVLSTSFAIQDFTSVLGTQGLTGGLRAVQNNIPIIINQLAAGGMSAATAASLAGGVSIVTVGLGLLIENWGTISQMWSKSSASELPKLRGDMEGLAGAMGKVSQEIADLEERSLTDVLDHASQKRLKELGRVKKEIDVQLKDQTLVEGVAATAAPEIKKLMDDVKQAVGEAGGGEAVAGNLRFALGGTYQEAVETVADALRGNRDALAKLVENSKVFTAKFEAIEEKRNDDALAVLRKEQAEWNDRLLKANQDFADKARENMERWTQQFADAMQGFNDRLQKQIDEFNITEANDPLGNAKEIIRDVEDRDFFHIDRNGREQGGLGMSGGQVEAAAKAAREFQRTHQVDDRTAAQLAIQEQLMLNQRLAADRQNQVGNRMQAILNQAQAVPEILDWGMGQ